MWSLVSGFCILSFLWPRALNFEVGWGLCTSDEVIIIKGHSLRRASEGVAAIIVNKHLSNRPPEGVSRHIASVIPCGASRTV